VCVHIPQESLKELRESAQDTETDHKVQVFRTLPALVCVCVYIYIYIHDVFVPQESLTGLREWVQVLDLTTECKFQVLCGLVDNGYTSLDILKEEDPDFLVSLQGMPVLKPGSKLMLKKAFRGLREVRGILLSLCVYVCIHACIYTYLY
jgi:hypothetical protein